MRMSGILSLIAALLLAAPASAEQSGDITKIETAFTKIGRTQYREEFGPYPDRKWRSYYSISKRPEGGIRLGFVREHEVGELVPDGKGHLIQSKPHHWLPVGDIPFSPTDHRAVIFDFGSDGALVEVTFNDEYYDEFQELFFKSYAPRVLYAAAELFAFKSGEGTQPKLELCGKYLFEVLTGLFEADADLGIEVCAKK